jgi:outer membrane receptor for ferrienterochelin and colicins
VSIIEIDPNLEPEESHSISASADYYHTFGRLQANILVEGFYTMLNDVFALKTTRKEVGDDGNNYIYKMRYNATGARVGGVTAEVKLGIPSIFDVQLGYTFQKSRYVEPEQWSETVTPQREMFRSPDHYGYLSSNFYITKQFNASLFGTFTGPMLVQHAEHTTPSGVVIPDAEVTTPSFLDCGIKLSYTFHLTNLINLEINAGVKNIFDSYQPDIDLGAGRDSAYIYGPSLPRTYFFGVKLHI